MSVDRTLRAARIAHAGGLATDALIADERGDRAEAKALMAEAEALLALPAEIAPTPEESEPRRLLVEAERLLVALADPDLTPEESKRLAGTLPEARRLVEESERLLAALAEGAPTAEESERLLALPMEAQRLLAEADRAIWEWAASGEGDPPPKRGRGQPRKPNVEVANMLMEIAVADTPTIVAAAERVATLKSAIQDDPRAAGQKLRAMAAQKRTPGIGRRPPFNPNTNAPFRGRKNRAKVDSHHSTEVKK